MWDGYGDIEQPDVRQRVELPGRSYLLYTGAVELVLPSITSDRDQSPTCGGPKTEPDSWPLRSTTPGALSVEARASSMRYSRRPARSPPGRLTDKPFYDSDRVNVELDAL